MVGIKSPTLLKWIRQINEEKITEEEFWKEVKTLGTPIIEDIGLDNQVLVTFLWQGSKHTQNVVVNGFLDGGPAYTPCENQMSRIDNTMIWFREYIIRDDARFAYHLVPNDPILLNHATDRERTLRSDPYNSSVYQRYKEDPEASVVHLPKAPVYPWLAENTSPAKGKVEKHFYTSELLKNSRDIWVYTPPDYEENKSCPTVFFTDGDLCVSSMMNVPNTLDNLIRSGQIPPVIAVMISPIDRKTRWHELTCNDIFVAFLAEELFPWVKRNWAISNKKEDIIISGISLGGLNAVYTAMKYPDIFGKVLSQSGSFWWAKEGDNEPEWLTHQLIQERCHHLIIYLEAGLFEDFREYNLLQANRHLRDILIALDNTVTYSEFSGGHDDQSWPGTLGYGLIHLLNM